MSGERNTGRTYDDWCRKPATHRLYIALGQWRTLFKVPTTKRINEHLTFRGLVNGIAVYEDGRIAPKNLPLYVRVEDDGIKQVVEQVDTKGEP